MRGLKKALCLALLCIPLLLCRGMVVYASQSDSIETVSYTHLRAHET